MSGKVNTAQRHDSALKHVTGQALYIDDMPEPPGTLHGALVLSTVACGRLVRLDTTVASTMPGVVAVLGPADIPGKNDVAAIGQNEPLFAIDRIEFAGQVFFPQNGAVSVLQPLEFREKLRKEGRWTPEELLESVGRLEIPSLKDIY